MEQDTRASRPRKRRTAGYTRPGGPEQPRIEPGPAAPAQILALQRAVGNRSVRRLLDARRGGAPPGIQRHEFYLSHFEIDLGDELETRSVNASLSPRAEPGR